MSASRPFVPHLCTFCGKENDAVECLIAGPNHQIICNECVEVCVVIVRKKRGTVDMIASLRRWTEESSQAPGAASISPWVRR
ncbi:ClpX C4-type zinc finger protein [Ancylobacter sp. WKF20]|uniref:ClpX C4-type zinc finger protein n=1 Tax=Ancylobacter sp. WKF20 TaxID=3039801 RepID=UPI0024341D03|nr:ClpX C4-type zinc finger protein [Ancylobacter sp. WKF20]WGD31874.1 ClpX C4-type zinc finger protein [Ancylobacter sp. WKF20]